MIINYEKVSKHIVDWIREYSKNANKKVLTFNMSIEIESAILAILCRKTNIQIYGICVNTNYTVEEQDIIKDVYWDIKSIYVNIENTYIDLIEEIDLQDKINEYRSEECFNINVNYFNKEKALNKFKDVSILPILSTINSGFNGLMVGSLNKNDSLIKDYNKYGSKSVDILPLYDLYHSEMIELYDYLCQKNRYSKSYVLDKARNDQPKIDNITSSEVEWADRENSRTNIITLQEDPVKHRDWPRYTTRQRQIIARLNQEEKLSRHKEIYNMPVCQLRHLDGFVR